MLWEGVEAQKYCKLILINRNRYKLYKIIISNNFHNCWHHLKWNPNRKQYLFVNICHNLEPKREANDQQFYDLSLTLSQLFWVIHSFQSQSKSESSLLFRMSCFSFFRNKFRLNINQFTECHNENQFKTKPKQVFP